MDPIAASARSGPGAPIGCAALSTELELTILLPCLDEAETVAVCVEKARGSLGRLGLAGEVLVADNGSSDGSREIAAAAGARVLDVPERGYGAALRAGIAAARGRFVLVADADDSYALDDIGGFVDALRGGADLVMGNRFRGGIAPGAMPFLHRRLGNPLLSYLGRLFFGLKVGDFHCGIRAFRRDAVLGLGTRSDGMEFASELLVRASFAGLRISEVPTTLRPDGRSGAPHLRTWRDGWRHLRLLLAFSPRWLLLYPALALLTVGFLGLVLLAFGTARIGQVSFSVQSMLACATAMIVGVQAAGLAIASRSYAANLELVPPSSGLERALERIVIERGVAVGGAAVIAGLIAFVAAVINWGAQGFGNLDVVVTIRWPILGMVLIVTGMQLIMVSFTESLANAGERAR
jgi:Glycosyl transferase family 2